MPDKIIQVGIRTTDDGSTSILEKIGDAATAAANKIANLNAAQSTQPQPPTSAQANLVQAKFNFLSKYEQDITNYKVMAESERLRSTGQNLKADLLMTEQWAAQQEEIIQRTYLKQVRGKNVTPEYRQRLEESVNAKQDALSDVVDARKTALVADAAAQRVALEKKTADDVAAVVRRGEDAIADEEARQHSKRLTDQGNFLEAKLVLIERERQRERDVITRSFVDQTAKIPANLPSDQRTAATDSLRRVADAQLAQVDTKAALKGSDASTAVSEAAEAEAKTRADRVVNITREAEAEITAATTRSTIEQMRQEGDVTQALIAEIQRRANAKRAEIDQERDDFLKANPSLSRSQVEDVHNAAVTKRVAVSENENTEVDKVTSEADVKTEKDRAAAIKASAAAEKELLQARATAVDGNGRLTVLAREAALELQMRESREEAARIEELLQTEYSDENTSLERQLELGRLIEETRARGRSGGFANNGNGIENPDAPNRGGSGGGRGGGRRGNQLQQDFGRGSPIGQAAQIIRGSGVAIAFQVAAHTADELANNISHLIVGMQNGTIASVAYADASTGVGRAINSALNAYAGFGEAIVKSIPIFNTAYDALSGIVVGLGNAFGKDIGGAKTLAAAEIKNSVMDTRQDVVNRQQKEIRDANLNRMETFHHVSENIVGSRSEYDAGQLGLENRGAEKQLGDEDNRKTELAENKANMIKAGEAAGDAARKAGLDAESIRNADNDARATFSQNQDSINVKWDAKEKDDAKMTASEILKYKMEAWRTEENQLAAHNTMLQSMQMNLMADRLKGEDRTFAAADIQRRAALNKEIADIEAAKKEALRKASPENREEIAREFVRQEALANQEAATTQANTVHVAAREGLQGALNRDNEAGNPLAGEEAQRLAFAQQQAEQEANLLDMQKAAQKVANDELSTQEQKNRALKDEEDIRKAIAATRAAAFDNAQKLATEGRQSALQNEEQYGGTTKERRAAREEATKIEISEEVKKKEAETKATIDANKALLNRKDLSPQEKKEAEQRINNAGKDLTSYLGNVNREFTEKAYGKEEAPKRTFEAQSGMSGSSLLTGVVAAAQNRQQPEQLLLRESQKGTALQAAANRTLENFFQFVKGRGESPKPTYNDLLR